MAKIPFASENRAPISTQKPGQAAGKNKSIKNSLLGFLSSEEAAISPQAPGKNFPSTRPRGQNFPNGTATDPAQTLPHPLREKFDDSFILVF